MEDDREIESTLILASDSPEAFADRLAKVRTLGAFTLDPPRLEAIEDRYFDVDQELQSRRIALRLRRLDNQVLIALKSDFERGSGPAERMEIEGPWTGELLERISRKLASRNVILDTVVDVGSTDPQATLAKMGFDVIQTRVTTRRVKTVIGPDSKRIADLAIDSVLYLLEHGEASLQELEVEAKGEGKATDVQAVTTELLESYPDELQPWADSKLATGKAIDSLLAAGKLRGVLGDTSTLNRAALRLVSSFLAHEP